VAVPTFFDAGAGNVQAATTTVVPAYPASIAANDIAVCVALMNGAADLTISGSYSPIVAPVNNANMSAAFWWLRLAGGDSAPTVTSSTTATGTSGLYARIYVFRGCITTGTPYEGEGSTAPTNTTTPDTTAVTTTDIDRLAASFLLVDDDTAWTTAPPPATWSSLGTAYTTTTGGDCRIDAIGKTVATASTEPAAEIGLLSGLEICSTCTVGLIPAAAAAAAIPSVAMAPRIPFQSGGW
jgi:hypothetical protein